MWEKFKTKITSRKFILASCADIVGFATLLTNSNDDTVKTIAAVVIIIFSTVAYIAGEAKIDAAVAINTLTAAQEVIKVVDSYFESHNEDKESKEISVETTVTETTEE